MAAAHVVANDTTIYRGDVTAMFVLTDDLGTKCRTTYAKHGSTARAVSVGMGWL